MVNQNLLLIIVVAELKRAPKTILFIDEVHTLIGSFKDGPMEFGKYFETSIGPWRY